MVDCRQSQKRYRWDHVVGCWVTGRVAQHGGEAGAAPTGPQRVFISVITDEEPKPEIEAKALKFFGCAPRIWINSSSKTNC